jgi:hypothetical protein
MTVASSADAIPVEVAAHPVTVDIAPAASQSRLTVFLRDLLIIPHFIVIAVLMIPLHLFTLIAWFTILIAGRYPVAMHRYSSNVLSWYVRIISYLHLLTGSYPPFAFDAPDYPVQVTIPAQTSSRSRLTTVFRPILLIPHIIAVLVLVLLAQLVLVIAWFAALILGRVPAGMHNFTAGVIRWWTRYAAYGLYLTDAYPPFSLK